MITEKYSLHFVVSVAVILVGLYIAVFLQTEELSAQYEDMTEEELQAELEKVEDQRKEAAKKEHQHKTEASSIERDIAVLESQIQQAQLNIQAKTITIQQLGEDIYERNQTIEDLEGDIDEMRNRLAHLLRERNEIDSYSFVEVLLSNKNVSEFFVDYNDFHAINDYLHQTLDEIRYARRLTAEEREELDQRRAKEIDARKVIEEERASIKQKEAEKQRLLNISRSQAAEYQQIVQEREQDAARIRSALFALRDTDDIPFGDALTYARRAQEVTGIRPAYLLAVFQQESGLREGIFGVNVGTCNRPGDEQGWKDIMPGPNDNSWRDDQTAYLELMKKLGRDPDTQPLSCPWGGGWGGAMGPAQFIPTTWSRMESKVADAVGVSVADPWDPEHAFMASAMYLADLGAAGGGYTTERNAACRYYSGRACDSGNPPNSFYGDGVMQNAEKLQKDIDILDSVD
ncbi:MAG: hypothetical protein ACLFNN_02780 [Candidatus Paceibacterota bacterium]